MLIVGGGGVDSDMGIEEKGADSGGLESDKGIDDKGEKGADSGRGGG